MIRLKIDGMTCGHCAKTVRETLAKVPNVEAVTEVSVERGEALISGEPETAALVAALHQEGYEAQVT